MLCDLVTARYLVHVDADSPAGRADLPGSEEDVEAEAEAGVDQSFFLNGNLNVPGPRIRPPQTESDVNFNVGGERGWAEKMEESPEDLARRIEGQKRAEEREMVRRAARRAVVFGFEVNEEPPHETDTKLKKHKSRGSKVEDGDATTKEQPRRKCEALMNGALVEPSFAKGNWAIRWRERS